MSDPHKIRKQHAFRPRQKAAAGAERRSTGRYDPGFEMKVELITKRDDLLIRRLVLEPGEGTPWHTDSCHRFSFVVRGEQLRIEFHETGEEVDVVMHPSLADLDEPDARVHRGVNADAAPYDQIVMFFLRDPRGNPQLEPANASAIALPTSAVFALPPRSGVRGPSRSTTSIASIIASCAARYFLSPLPR